MAEAATFNDILQAISTVGFPIICCIVLFLQNDKLRTTIDENTKAILTLTDYFKISRNKEDG